MTKTVFPQAKMRELAKEQGLKCSHEALKASYKSEDIWKGAVQNALGDPKKPKTILLRHVPVVKKEEAEANVAEE